MPRKIPTTTTGPAAAFYKRLRALGYTLCGQCFAYMPPDHQHVAPLALDKHASRYVLVGGFGNVRAIDREEETAA